MNFDEAISSHTGWKMKLARYIAKPDGSLKSAQVSTDHNCELGKWIHGAGGPSILIYRNSPLCRRSMLASTQPQPM